MALKKGKHWSRCTYSRRARPFLTDDADISDPVEDELDFAVVITGTADFAADKPSETAIGGGIPIVPSPLDDGTILYCFLGLVPSWTQVNSTPAGVRLVILPPLPLIKRGEASPSLELCGRTATSGCKIFGFPLLIDITTELGFTVGFEGGLDNALFGRRGEASGTTDTARTRCFRNGATVPGKGKSLILTLNWRKSKTIKHF